MTNNEISGYCSENVACTDLLKFWSECSRYPTLQRLAKRIHSWPASSAQSERLYSTAGKTISPLRSSMKPQTLIACVKVKKNLD